MRSGITLILKRDTHALWVMQEGYDVVLFYDVTGVERVPSNSARFPVIVFHNGKSIGLIWNVVEIKEVW